MKGETLSRFREELEKELKDNILSWWMKYSPDNELGGFHGHIDHLNQVVEGAGKGAVLNARILWTFSAAYRMYKQPEYLKLHGGPMPISSLTSPTRNTEVYTGNWNQMERCVHPENRFTLPPSPFMDWPSITWPAEMIRH